MTHDEHAPDEHAPDESGQTLPTPFTAEQIRDATPAGHTIETLTEEHDVVTRRRVTFTDCDDEGASIVSVALDDTGEPAGEPVTARATWADLQAHAAFPADVTVRSTDTIETGLGTFECLRYEVQRGDDVMVFWFALDLPGMPVHVSTSRDGEAVSITQVTAMTGVA